MKKQLSKWLTLLAAALLLGGCASMDATHLTKTWSNQEYAKASVDARAKYRADILAEEDLLQPKKLAEYQAGRVVKFGEGGITRYVVWDRLGQMVYVYPDKETGALNIKTNAIVVMRTDSQGNIINQHDHPNQPVTVLANVSSEEGNARFWIGKLLAPVATGVVTGTGAAAIMRDAACSGGNCGGGSGATIVNQNLNEAGALSVSNSAARAAASMKGGGMPMK